jgi:molybdopterin-guanine dinucleotide biosynthesis protein A
MGCNKALLDFGGQPLIRILIDRIRPLTERIVISSNDASIYQFLNFPVVPDQFRGHGPLAGFHSAMRHENCSIYLMLACDLPNLKESLLRNLVALVDGYDAAIPLTSDGITHPLCAAYRRTCLLPIEESLKRGTRKVIETFLEDSLTVRWVGPEEGGFQDADLVNINTPEDLARLKSGTR